MSNNRETCWAGNSHLLNKYSRISQSDYPKFTIKRIAFRIVTKIYPVLYEHLPDISTIEVGSVQFLSVKKSPWNHRSYVWTVALSGMVSAPAQVIKYTMNIVVA